MNFKAFLWFTPCTPRRKLPRAGGSQTDGSTSLQIPSPSNQRNHWQKYLETLRNCFACFWTYLSHHHSQAHIQEQDIREAVAGHKAVSGKRPGKREATSLQGDCSAPLQALRIRRSDGVVSITHLLTAHLGTSYSMNLANPDQFSGGFTSYIMHHTFIDIGIEQ